MTVPFVDSRTTAQPCWPMMLRLAPFVIALLLACPARAADRWLTSSDGVRLHYTDTGPATARETLVLVPGWTMPGWIFDRQISDLSRDYRVIAFDPRGQGQSDIAFDGYEPGRRGEDIADLLRVVGPERPVVVGWSLGVLDTLAYVHGHGGERIAGLVLIDNSVGEDPPPVASPAGPKPRRHAPPVSREILVRRFVRGMFDRTPDAGYLERLSEAALRTPAFAAAQLLAYPMPRTYWRDALFSAGVPVLYVVRPRLAGQAGNLAAHDPQAESVVMQGVGHALFVDDAPRFDALLRDFLRRRVWP